jgi:hypothetical protein
MLVILGQTRNPLMFDILCELEHRRALKANRRALRGLFLCMFLSFLFGFAYHSAAAAADSPSQSVASAGAGSHFAIADFDGDRRLDFASVQAGASSSGTANYSIQLRLTTAGRQSIQLLAPAGGLSIEARDVNGDSAIDLVLTTAWFRHPVAIFLNNGHGGFSRAEPAGFPGAFSASKTNWLSTTKLATDAVGVPTQSGPSICAEERDSPHERSPEGFVPSASAGFPVNSFLISRAGRAPPFEVSHL